MRTIAALHLLKKMPLRTSLVALSLCLPCTVALSEWTKVDQSEEATILADIATIRRAGTNVKLWTLTNLARVKVIDGKRHRSSKAQFEVDCKEERLRILATIFYEKLDGKGAVVNSTPGIEYWEPVAPETIASELMRFACSQ